MFTNCYEKISKKNYEKKVMGACQVAATECTIEEHACNFLKMWRQTHVGQVDLV